jgi:hypothetical protein
LVALAFIRWNMSPCTQYASVRGDDDDESVNTRFVPDVV